jgi:hypothetical protein
MEIAVVIEGIKEKRVRLQPWIYYKGALAKKDIHIKIFHGKNYDAFKRPFDAMLLHVWQDWGNRQLFDPCRILPIMEKHSIYRAEFPEATQIILNHTDMARRPFATPYWRQGDPILYRTPAYDRKELYPFPAEQIWAFEQIWGNMCFISETSSKHKAGFIGKPNGPADYRKRVAYETAKIGIGICQAPLPFTKDQYNEIMGSCQIIVCPRGWGEQSRRHWDAWLSGKPVLTDKECDSVEMIPGMHLKEGEHYLVFEDPKEIPDIVSDWTQRSRLDDLAQIAENGRRAALSYDAFHRIAKFFKRAVSGNDMI